MRRWAAENGLDASADGYDVPAGGARLMVGDPMQAGVMMDDLVLLAGHNPKIIWLLAHEGCAGIAARGIKFTNRDHELQSLRGYVRGAGAIIRRDDRFDHVPSIRMAVGKQTEPNSDDFVFEEVRFMPGDIKERNDAPVRIKGPPAAQPRA